MGPVQRAVKIARGCNEFQPKGASPYHQPIGASLGFGTSDSCRPARLLSLRYTQKKPHASAWRLMGLTICTGKGNEYRPAGTIACKHQPIGASLGFGTSDSCRPARLLSLRYTQKKPHASAWRLMGLEFELECACVTRAVHDTLIGVVYERGINRVFPNMDSLWFTLAG